MKPEPPFIPGHEGVGHVVAVGDGVKHVKEGDRVGVPWLYSACGHCEHCLGGWETLCESQENTGYSVNGGFADYTLADAGYVGRLPDNVDFLEIAPVLCAGVTVYKGLKMTEARPGQWVVISGIGGLGHMAVQYAKAMGFNVAAVDIDDGKLALAERLGATLTVNALRADPAEVLKRDIGGAHGVLVTAVSPKAFDQAQRMLRRGGTLVLNGLPPGEFRCRSSTRCLTASPCAAPSSAPVRTCRRRSTSPAKARSRPPWPRKNWTTSTMSSSACWRARSKGASCSI